MIVFRRRYWLWLIKAYIKKWGKSIIASFLVGLMFFFILKSSIAFLIAKLPVGNKQIIGIVGAYTVSDLPSYIIHELSHGLTILDENGAVKKGLSESWKIEENGKKYTFTLKKNKYFTDGTKVTSDKITYPFSDVAIDRPNNNSIVFKLKDAYSPFLLSASKPLFKPGYVGVGDYKIRELKLNGTFVESLTIVSKINPYKVKTYHFYPTEEALKTAFALGEVTKAINLSSTDFKDTNFRKFPKVKVSDKIDYERLVTSFYNIKDPIISDDRIRDSLSYSIPQEFSLGKRHKSPFLPKSWAYTEKLYERELDIDHAKELLESAGATISANTKIAIKTMKKYKKTAEELSLSFKKINLNTQIEIVDRVPDTFQIYVGDFIVPKDPDQYTLWHSNQPNNITNYKNLRIDKLLEDGRKTLDQDRRKKIYSDFQKYLIDDSPASFLYFPYKYDVERV